MAWLDLTFDSHDCSITYMSSSPQSKYLGPSIRSTAERQRERIIDHALRVFAVSGYYATPVAEVAAAANVSPAYVFRLFDGKLGLFVAVVDRCFSQVTDALTAGGEAGGGTSTDRLDAMTAAYVELIRDRNLILVQAHAQSTADVPEIRDAVQRGLALVVRAVLRVSGASEKEVQRFIAYGQLCHLIVQAGLDDLDAEWATVLTQGISHPGAR